MKKYRHSIDHSVTPHDYHKGYYNAPFRYSPPGFTPPIPKHTDEPDIDSELDAIVTRIEYSKLSRDLGRETDDDYLEHLRKKDRLTRDEVLDRIGTVVLWVLLLVVVWLVFVITLFLINYINN